MKDQKKASIPFFFIIGAMGLGIMLSLFGIASGDNPIIKPDLKAYSESLQQNQVSGEQLVEWVVQGKRDFIVAGFGTANECNQQKKITKEFKCYDVQNLDDARWIRKRFKNFSMPLIIYGNSSDEGLQAAARLAHYGYNTRVLEGGFADFNSQYLQPDYAGMDIYELDEEQLQQLSIYRYFTGDDPLVKTPGQKWVIAMADTSGDMLEEEEEGYEEGGEDEEFEDDEEFEEEEEEEEEGC
jgi:hypothetical protein